MDLKNFPSFQCAPLFTSLAAEVGYYGLPSVRGFDMKSALRRIEEWLIPRRGNVLSFLWV